MDKIWMLFLFDLLAHDCMNSVFILRRKCAVESSPFSRFIQSSLVNNCSHHFYLSICRNEITCFQ
ncbi:unnamed protein product [Phytomonas sp. EM1]|nr:unnamed protein product [Phytomonas sp. EM1]|eukprot:CCW62395.1 unnamed protein product [Phytomonas sp. isolate EM1]